MIRLGGVVLALFAALACAPRESVRAGGDRRLRRRHRGRSASRRARPRIPTGSRRHRRRQQLSRRRGRDDRPQHRSPLPRLHRAVPRQLRRGREREPLLPGAGQPRLADRRRQAVPGLLRAARERALLHRAAWAGRAVRRRQRRARARRGHRATRSRRAGCARSSPLRTRRTASCCSTTRRSRPARTARPTSCSGRSASGARRRCSPATTTATSASRRAACRTWWWARAVRLCTNRSRPSPAAWSASSAPTARCGSTPTRTARAPSSRARATARATRSSCGRRASSRRRARWSARATPGSSSTARRSPVAGSSPASTRPPGPPRRHRSGSSTRARAGRAHTTYYRREFELDAAPAAFAELSLGLPRDQPAVAWLNGREVARVERSKREHTWLVPRGPRADPTAAPILMHFWLAAGLLQTGANVLAIEVQRDPGQGGDPGFDAELTAYLAARPGSPSPASARRARRRKTTAWKSPPRWYCSTTASWTACG